MKIKFTKMQAYGNDYVYIDAINQKLPELKKLAIAVSNRHFGIGSDGMVLICPSDKADFRMRIFDPDGTEAEMCGNAIRSTAMFVYYHKLTDKTTLKIETLGGIKTLDLTVKDGKVINIHAMIGKAEFGADKVPVITDGETFIDQELEVAGKIYRASSISLGNPHTALFEEDLDNLDIEKYGPAAENHPVFPKRTNVTFAKLVDRTHIMIREWERGCGETIGCGTGCCTAVVVMNRLGLCDRRVEVQQIGGVLLVELDNDGNIHMTGPSNVVFEGEYYYEA